MLFEWDEAKRRRNLTKHGVDFADMLQAFDGRPTLEWQDTRRHYSERRWRRLAEIEGALYHIAYTRRGPSVRLISARSASRRERKTYYSD